MRRTPNTAGCLRANLDEWQNIQIDRNKSPSYHFPHI